MGGEEELRRMYGLPADHTLVQTAFRQKGSFAERESWTHEERDTAGALVATYESWSNSDLKGGGEQQGWRKRAPDGTVLEEHHGV